MLMQYDVALKDIWGLVYQSGHTDTWCDGKTHINMGGGRFGYAPINNQDIIARVDIYKCDCEYWVKRKENDV